MPRYIDANKIDYRAIMVGEGEYAGYRAVAYESDIDEMPTADVVEIETLKAWLYEIAMNNVGCHVDDLASACEEIVSRLDGLRALAGERRNDENS